jgi:protocatechuate 3,4-dioxygenase beta subunit
LILILLSGWLGSAEQSAEAQQTVTLSGRVTDATGQAVSGATVNLEDPGWVGQETDANGAYRLSVSPGTYRLRVRPPRGPLIAQKIEGLRLSTNTTRNFVLETGVTLSGRVTGPGGQPVPRAWLWVRTDAGQEISFNSANEAGQYSLGVPVGTYQINVGHDDFLNPKLEGIEVTQDTVFNITLESGVVLEGRVVDNSGQPVPDAEVCAYLPTEDRWFCFGTEVEGSFQLRVLPDAVYVITARPPAPLHPTRLRLEVSGEQVSDLVLTVSRDPTPFVPDDPPQAALISISPPTAAGEVTLRGAAGCVAPESTVFITTLNTGHFITVQATASGSFTATLFAPAGTSVLIRADPFGATVARFLDEFSESGEPSPNMLSAFPSTILRVMDSPSAGIPISGAGKIDWDRFPAWTFHGSIPTHTYTPGDSLRVQGTVQVESPALQGVGDSR